MLESDENVQAARALGLSTYEARAYLALLSLGEAKASEIASLSGIPRGRIYDVLDRLHEKGLIEIVPATPRTFRAVLVLDFLERRKGELRAEILTLEKSAQTLSARSHVGAVEPGAEHGFLLFRGRRAVLDRLEKMIGDAKKEILLSCTNAHPFAVQPALVDALRQKTGQGVDIRIATDIRPENLEVVTEIARFAKVRHLSLTERLVTVICVDGSKTICCEWGGEHLPSSRKADFAVVSTSPGLVGALRSLLARNWERGTVPSFENLRKRRSS